MILEIFRMALEALTANKIRTLLSMLGIIIGVSTVIAVVGIGTGAQKDIEEQYKNLSVTSIIVMGNMGREATTTSKISAEDVDAILENGEYIQNATASISGNLTVSYGKETGEYSVVGSLPNLFEISNLNLEVGRIFTEEENLNREKVAVIGSTIVDDLFESDIAAAIGNTISVNNKKVEIIGVLQETGSSMGPMLSFDESIYTPYITADKNLLGKNKMTTLTVLANSVDNIDKAMEELSAILREAHKLKDTQDDDFRLMDAGSMVGAAQNTASTMTILLTSVAAIVLLVSGVGIMNVMFVTVAERTKEIGIAKAIGGKQTDILAQFLLESVILSVVGGIIGIIVGQLILPVVSTIANMTVTSSIEGILLAFMFSVIVGIFFGFYPAIKASRLDPVDALRSE